MNRQKYIPGSWLLRTLVATLGGVAVGAVCSQLAVKLSGEPLQLRYLLPNTLWLLSMGFVLGVPVVLAYALPLHLLLRRLNAVNLATALLVGALPGLIAFLYSPDRFAVMVFCSGLAVAAIFQFLTHRSEKAVGRSSAVA